jgi:hypothetical protein
VEYLDLPSGFLKVRLKLELGFETAQKFGFE